MNINLEVAKELGLPPEKVHRLLVAFQKYAVKQGRWQTCLNCVHWQKTVGKEHCTKFNAMPPPDIIVHSCVEWEDDIPF